MDVKSGRFMYQSGRAGDEAKKCKSPTKSGRVGITASILRSAEHMRSSKSRHRPKVYSIPIFRPKWLDNHTLWSHMYPRYICTIPTAGSWHSCITVQHKLFLHVQYIKFCCHEKVLINLWSDRFTDCVYMYL